MHTQYGKAIAMHTQLVTRSNSVYKFSLLIPTTMVAMHTVRDRLEFGSNN